MNTDDSIVIKRRSLFHKIVNGFLYTLLTGFIILVIIFGFSQTSTFRNILRENLVEILNDNINGVFSLEQIDGTIFTSLILRNTILTDRVDTIASIKKIELKLSPLKILLKQIYVRSISIEDANIVLLKDTSGVLNISKVFPSTDEDTTSSDFPFTIRVADLSLSGINFKIQTYANRNSSTSYDVMNFDDLRISDLRVRLNAFASITDNDYELELNEIGFNPNFNFMPDLSLSGSFSLNENYIQVANLNLKSRETKIYLSAKIERLNIFDEINAEVFKNAGVTLNLESENFDFDLLTTFIPPLEILKGKINANLQAEGTFKELIINKLDLSYIDTKLFANGKISNIDNIDEFLIDATILNSELNYNNVNSLLPTLDLPKYNGLEKVYFDTLTYKGSPFDFKGRYAIRLKSGSINGDLALDYRTSIMKYDLNLDSKNIDLNPIFAIPLTLNLSSSVKGLGTDADHVAAEFKINAGGSSYRNIRISDFNMFGKVENRFFYVETDAQADSQKISFFANLNFDDSDKPVYRINTSLTNFNLAEWLDDSTFSTGLNINLFGIGESFDPEKINTRLECDVQESKLGSRLIPNSRIELVVKTSEEDYKNLEIKSNFFDGMIEGNFRYDTFFAILNKEIEKTTSSFINKIDMIYPLDKELIESYKSSMDISAIPFQKNKKKVIEDEFLPVSLKYNFNLKDFSIIKALVDSSEIELEGQIYGSILSNQKGFNFDVNFDADFLKFVVQEEPYFLFDAKILLELNHPLNKNTFDDLELDFTTRIKKLFIGTEINDIYADLSLSRSIFSITSGVVLSDKMKPSLNAQIDLTKDSLRLNISKLFINYGDFILLNKNDILIDYKDEALNIKQFELRRGDSELKIKGQLSIGGTQDLTLELKNFKGYDLSYSLLGIQPEEVIDGDVTLLSSIKGTLENPEINLTLTGDSISYKKKNFGSLKSNFIYNDKLITANIRFVEKVDSLEEERLLVDGSFPIDLSVTAGGNRLPEDKEVLLSIFSDNFNLAAFGDALPFIDRLRGTLSTNIKVTGTYAQLSRTGYLRLTDASFLAESNNLEYNAGIVLRLEENSLFLDSLLIKNIGIVKNIGSLTGSGKVDFDGLSIKEMRFALKGNLTVLSNESRIVSPAIYGNLFIETDGEILFTSIKDKSYLRAPIIIKQADLFFPPSQSGYSGNSGNFIYKFAEDTINFSRRELEIQKLLALSNLQNGKSESEITSSFNFDYNISIKIEDESKITFIFAKEANNRLVAVLSGKLLYESRQGIQNIQGELKLLEGSTLEFFKTFSAAGVLRFESDITNPYLDIIATYRNFLADTATATTGKEQEVAVKIKLKGPLQELSKSFSSMDNNIAVYYGSDAIENDVASTQYDKSDAVWFILTGKFKNEVTPNDQSRITGTATALAGSLLGGVLNAYLGDYVKTLDIRSAGSTTKINLSGRFKDFRYTIGGTTNTLQDFSTANIRIEYPIIQNLILRVERKDALTETGYQNIMINELGLRYKFEF